MDFNGTELVGEWGEAPKGGVMPVSEETFVNQIRINCRRNLPLVKLEAEHDKIMVMVCGGPTAKDHLEEIRAKRKDDKYRIFCSNKTHDWLIKNDIIPHYQFIIDPKESKLLDVKNPHKDVEYIIGLCCHPGVIDQLKDYKVTMVASLSGTIVNGMSDLQLVNAFFEKDEFIPLEGGTMAGLRAMTLANVLGYRSVEFYGFDSCFFDKDKDGNPIYYSYPKARGENILECECDDGRMFLSTPVFASQAREFIKWKHRLAWINFTIHGDSFTAHVNKLDEKDMKPKTKLLISDYMLEMNKKMFAKNEKDGEYQMKYAVSGGIYAGQIAVLAGQLVKKYGEGLTLLDYGCGRGYFADVFPNIQGLEVKMYDPCVDKYSEHPEPADMVICTDVLEHVEKGCLENVLDDLQKLTKKLAFVAICLTPAGKNYSDGRNCHLTLMEYDLWYAKLRKRFRVIEQKREKGPTGHDMYICVLQAKEIK